MRSTKQGFEVQPREETKSSFRKSAGLAIKRGEDSFSGAAPPNPRLVLRAKTLIRWGTLTLALSRARERGSCPLSRWERAGVRGSIVRLSAIALTRVFTTQIGRLYAILTPESGKKVEKKTIMKLLHVIATPRKQDSNTMRVATAFLESLHAKSADLSIDTVDLFTGDLPDVAGDNIETKYSLMTSQPINKRHKESWKHIELLIEHFLSADIYLISTPMWNFSIPYALKYYIDSIIQPGYLYKYNEQGLPVGLVHGKKMICVTSRGGDYSEKNPLHACDFQEPYLRAIFGFVGITDMHFINAQPMDITQELREAAIAAAIEEARSLVANYEWDVTKTIGLRNL